MYKYDAETAIAKLAELKQLAIENGLIVADGQQEAPEDAAFLKLIQEDLCHGSNDQVTGELVYLISLWHHRRNLIEGSTDKDQFHKLIQECAELSDNMCKKRDIRDDIGDIMVVLINIMARNKLTMSECLETALRDIAPRKGKMIDGIFVKEKDLLAMAQEANGLQA